jgi:DNA-binding HxlR family transcriptional regulator
MRWDEIDDSLCSFARTLGVIGDRWTMLVLREAFLGTRRYDDFQRHLAAAPHIVAARLKKLVEHKVLEKRRYQDHPPRYEYRLTERGHELYPALIALIGWGEKWLKSAHGPASIRTHKNCNHRLQLVASCAACGEPVTARDVTAQLTPRYAAERARRAAGAEPKTRKKASG